jgi:hypothetical protein
VDVVLGPASRAQALARLAEMSIHGSVSPSFGCHERIDVLGATSWRAFASNEESQHRRRREFGPRWGMRGWGYPRLDAGHRRSVHGQRPSIWGRIVVADCADPNGITAGRSWSIAKPVAQPGVESIAQPLAKPCVRRHGARCAPRLG